MTVLPKGNGLKRISSCCFLALPPFSISQELS
uniref:Uncharacterized protein n=1 Tax=Anguilla anguilla TaxID=7936 RepID=A0A0E9WLU7_ANGAN